MQGYALNFKNLSMIKKINPETTIVVVMIAAIGALRIAVNLNHDITAIANFSPVGAMAIFGAATFSRKWTAFAFPLFTLFISDVILHQTVFKNTGNGLLYGGWYWVYGAFALMTIAGRWIMRTISIARFLLSAIACVFIHWTITDLGVWAGSKTFSQDLSGYFQCLALAIPFEVRFLVGTLIYGMILFGIFSKLRQRDTHPWLAKS